MRTNYKEIKYQVPALAELGQALSLELELYNKISEVSTPKFNRDATVGGNPKAHKGTCMTSFFLIAPTPGLRHQ